MVRIEYKFCPNLTIIDTPGEHPERALGNTAPAASCHRCLSNRRPLPALTGVRLSCTAVRLDAGLISAAPGKRNSTLQNSARQVEAMVRMKMEQREYIILCLEDSNDWSNATTRRLVMQVGGAQGSPPGSRGCSQSSELHTRH